MDAMYMVDLMQCVDKLATSCGIKEPVHPHQRGNFAQMRIGWNHGMGEAENVSLLPMLSFLRVRSKVSPRCRIAYAFILITSSTSKNFSRQSPLSLRCKFYRRLSGLALSLMYLVSRVGNELFRIYFPKAAEFLQGLDKFWQNKTNGIVNMEFGFFYLMAINLPMAHEVKSIPHVDGMNAAFGPCAIMPIGEPLLFFFYNRSFPTSQDSFHPAFKRGWSTIAFV